MMTATLHQKSLGQVIFLSDLGFLICKVENLNIKLAECLESFNELIHVNV